MKCFYLIQPKKAFLTKKALKKICLDGFIDKYNRLPIQ